MSLFSKLFGKNTVDTPSTPKTSKVKIDPMIVRAARVLINKNSTSSLDIEEALSVNMEKAMDICCILRDIGIISSPDYTEPIKLLIHNEQELANIIDLFESDPDYIAKRSVTIKYKQITAAKSALSQTEDQRIQVFFQGLIFENRKAILSLIQKNQLEITDIPINELSSEQIMPVIGKIADDKIHINIDLADDKKQAFTELYNAYKQLSRSDMSWIITSEQVNSDIKSSASLSIGRDRVFLFTNNFNNILAIDYESTPFFKNKNHHYFIYPEFIVQAKNSLEFNIIDIKDIKINYKSQRFIEDTIGILLPKDAKLISYTYEKVNSNGTPDMRYSRNRRLPIYEYGQIDIEPLGLSYQISNAAAAKKFVECFNNYQKSLTNECGSNAMISEELFNNLNDIVEKIVAFHSTIENDASILTATSFKCPNCNDIDPKLLLKFMLWSDAILCIQGLGHRTGEKQKEDVGLHMLIGRTQGLDTPIKYEFLDQLLTVEAANKLICDLSKCHEVSAKSRGQFNITELLNICSRQDLRNKYITLLYRFSSVIAKADGKVSEEEIAYLSLMSDLSIANNCPTNPTFANQVESTNIINIVGNTNIPVTEQPDYFKKLDALIGLYNVKREITDLSNLLKIQSIKKSRGIKTSDISYHCVFTGNPGTGKTTVARIVAGIYKQLGILKKGHLVETDRSGLVGEYVGQTAPKTNAIIDSALDGVLFIDEAYSLIQGGANDYGKEAIATLLKRMEDDRTRLVVIIAGYTKEMQEFINSNSGLQSRFNRYINFPDYDKDELLQIFQYNLNNNDCTINESALQQVEKYVANTINNKTPKFGNARFIRNLFEKILTQQANRLAKVPNITNEMLSKIETEDVEAAINNIQSKNL